MLPTLSIILIVVATGMWFWALFDLSRSRFYDPWVRTTWLIVVVFFPLLGPIIYFQMKKRYVLKDRQPLRRRFNPKFNN